METNKEESEGNLITAFVALAAAPKNFFKAGALYAYDKIAGTNDSRDFMDRFEEFMERDCNPYATKKKRE